MPESEPLEAEQETQHELVRNDLGRKELSLRGPREGKKSTAKQVDEKKLNLAKSLFRRGKK